MQLPGKQTNINSIRDPHPAIEQFIILRIAILSLGESQHFGWWKSQFLSSTGLSFLDRIFPRTKFAAAVRSATRVAQHVHDAAIGRGEVTHLFRSDEKEEAIAEYLFSNEEGLSKYFSPKLNSKDALIRILSEMADEISWPKQSGPVRITKSQWMDLQTLSAVYLQGFMNKTPIFPYVTD